MFKASVLLRGQSFKLKLLSLQVKNIILCQSLWLSCYQPGLAWFHSVRSSTSGWYQDLWELEESSRGDGASALVKGIETGPFSGVGNCQERYNQNVFVWMTSLYF